MPFFVLYLLKVSVSLALVFLFYHFVLRKITFYNWNRWYLYGYIILSFFIPFMDISPVLEQNKWSDISIVDWVPVISQTEKTNGIAAANAASFSVWNLIILILVLGMLIMLTRLIIQFLSFQRMKRRAEYIPGNGMNIYQVNDSIIPFSFGNSIFINCHQHTESELQEIIRHEFVHVKQGHSSDIILGEVLCLLNWFNPFAWLLRKAIRQNLEFIADNKVLENGINKKEYQYLLLKVIGNNQYSIATQFNFSSLKKRIAMMNKIKSAKVHLLKFLFLLPVAIVMLLAFRNKNEKGQQQSPEIARESLQDTVPAPKKNVRKIPDEISSIGLMQSQEDASSTDPVKQKLHGLVGVKRKDGKIEVYDLDKEESRNSFEKKYGVKLEDLIPPPPPPPPPPAAGMAMDEYEARKNDFLERNPDVKSIGWLYNNVRENLVIEAQILKKDGTIEKYDMSNQADKAKAEKKYGELPLPASAPPAPPDPIQLPGNVEKININNKKATVWLKNGEKENYDLNVPAQKEAFEKKYGETIPLPPPPRPVRETGINLRGISDEFEITDKSATIKLKDNTIEKYDLTNKGQRAAFEKKYGRIISTNYNSNININNEAPVINPSGSTLVVPVTARISPVAEGRNISVNAISSVTGEISIVPVAVKGQVTGTVSVNPVVAISPVKLTVVDDYGHVITGNEDIIITITKKTTRQELEEFKKQMKDKGIELSFEEIEYNDKGILTNISGTMKSKDGHSNFVASDFDKVILAMIKKGEKTYFKVSVRDDKVVI